MILPWIMLIRNMLHRWWTLPKPKDRRERNREYDTRRRNDKPYRGWYNTKRWQIIRDHQLHKQPLCERCKAKNRIVQATVCHHTVKHDGDPVLFWTGPFASSCKDCHDTIEQAIEARGYEVGCDVNGRPTAPDHPWNLKR